jgi:hypothetical protein
MQRHSHVRRKRGSKRPARAANLADRLEVERETLLRRLARLHASAKRRPGYKTALRLLNPTFRKADLTARIAILQAASFMVEVLERIPPPL